MLTIKDITKTYRAGGKTIYALKGIDLTVNKGELLAVIGKSGCGKSTLLHLVAGLIRPTEGVIDYDGEAVTGKSREERLRFRMEHIGIILQDFSLLNDRTICANVELPLKIRGVKKAERRELAESCLKKLGIEELSLRYPGQVSGGQRQRAAIARALVCDADIILADEPTGALDEENGAQVVGILRDIAHRGKTVIMATHDKNAMQKCDRCIMLDHGELCE